MQNLIDGKESQDPSNPDTLHDLYRQMAEMTYEECKKHCNFDAVCCSRMYCNFAIRTAEEKYGIELKQNDSLVPLFDKELKQCMAPAHMRPLCTLHICEKLLWNREFGDRYFKLRERIEKQEGDMYEFI